MLLLETVGPNFGLSFQCSTIAKGVILYAMEAKSENFFHSQESYVQALF